MTNLNLLISRYNAPKEHNMTTIQVAQYVGNEIFATLNYYLDEINDCHTRATILHSTYLFLEKLKKWKWIKDYKDLQCNTKNNTPEVIDNKELRLDVTILVPDMPGKTIDYYIGWIIGGAGRSFGEINIKKIEKIG